MASNGGSVSRRGRLFAWFDRRLPIQAFLDSQLTGYYAPKNLNIWYYFGALAYAPGSPYHSPKRDRRHGDLRPSQSTARQYSTA